tara:strand:+ start:1726 stop:2223 length:498 start_codon:yes stop_codon:yes gene_type:complete
MYYKIDLNNYKPKEVRHYLTFNDYNKISIYQLEAIENELNNFQDSFGRPWKEWDMSDLEYRLKNNWRFYLVGNGRDGLELPVIEGWAFIDYNWEIPYLCNRYVVPQYRDGKLGEDLVWMRFNDLKEQGYDNCYGFIDNWNTPARVVSRKLKGLVEEYESLDIKKK